MPVINSTTPITADGTYFFQRLKPGAQYILTLSGTQLTDLEAWVAA